MGHSLTGAVFRAAQHVNELQEVKELLIPWPMFRDPLSPDELDGLGLGLGLGLESGLLLIVSSTLTCLVKSISNLDFKTSKISFYYKYYLLPRVTFLFE